MTLLTPLEAETASENALIPAVLRQGTADHPDLESLSAALDELYGGAIEPVVRKRERDPVRGFCGQLPGRRLYLEERAVLEGRLPAGRAPPPGW